MKVLKSQKMKCLKRELKNSLLGFLGDLSPDCSYADRDATYDDDNHSFIEIVKQARGDWIAAQNYFENVTDPDLIDYAIYTLEAARRRYMYLIKQAKKQGIKSELF